MCIMDGGSHPAPLTPETVGELPIGRRFQIKGRKYIFMRVDPAPYLKVLIEPGLRGTLVLNLDTGMIFCMESSTPAL